MEERIYKPGEHIGNYQVIEHLASGAFSAIYKVHDMEDAPDAGASALKTCRFDRKLLTEEAQLDYNRRLDREFRLIANLNHQGVVAALESRYHDGLGYYAMELIEGPTLGRFLSEARRPFAVLLDLFQQLTETLAYCHRQGVVHRDLHPWNILLSTRDKRRTLSEQESGEEGNYEEGSTLSEQGRLGRQGVIRTPYVPVILDFGISHDLSTLPITAPRQIVGAPLYLTPDSWRRRSAASLREGWRCSLL